MAENGEVILDLSSSGPASETPMWEFSSHIGPTGREVSFHFPEQMPTHYCDTLSYGLQFFYPDILAILPKRQVTDGQKQPITDLAEARFRKSENMRIVLRRSDVEIAEEVQEALGASLNRIAIHEGAGLVHHHFGPEPIV